MNSMTYDEFPNTLYYEDHRDEINLLVAEQMSDPTA